MNSTPTLVLFSSYQRFAALRPHLARVEALPGVRLACPAEPGQAAFREAAREAAVIVDLAEPVDSALLSAAPLLKGVVRWGSGYEWVDVESATARGVVVANVPVLPESVAESALLLMLALARRLFRQIQFAREAKRADDSLRGIMLQNRTLGIVGMGKIGRALAGMALGMNMRVIGYDPYISGPLKLNSGAEVPLVSLEELLPQSQFLSLHCNLTPETRHLLNKETLQNLPRGAFLVNTARGGLVDETALLEALQEGHLAGAALDVFEQEPLDPANPLLALENVIATPHFLGQTEEVRAAIAEEVSEAVLAILAGRAPRYVVTA